MSKAQTRRGSSASRSGAARAGTNAKGRRTSGGAANGARQQGNPAGRGQAAGANSAQRGGTGAGPGASATTGSGAARRQATSAGKAPAREEAKVATAEPTRGKRWLLGMTGVEASTLILSLIGLGVSIYATLLHYDSNIKPFCSDSGAIDCQAVMTSAQSVVFGIFPVAVLGMAFFLFMIGINSPWAWRARFPHLFDRFGGRALSARPELIGRARLGAIIVGMGFAIYLIYAELVQVGKICLWCTSVHIITFLLFIIIVFHASFSWGRSDAPQRT